MVLLSAFVTTAAFTLWAPAAEAYELYSEDQNTVGNCAQCHLGFRDTNDYFSHKDDALWGDSLHSVHVGSSSSIINTSQSCDFCHGGTGTNNRQVNLRSSAEAPDGVNAIACSGCHGSLEDTNDVTSLGTGWGAGLRQHHFRANRNIDIGGGTMVSTQVCVVCHEDSNPVDFTPVGENTAPPYYATWSLDPCDASGRGEDFAGSTTGLDNDGNDVYDGNDSDCGVSATTTLPPTTTTTLPPTTTTTLLVTTTTTLPVTTTTTLPVTTTTTLPVTTTTTLPVTTTTTLPVTTTTTLPSTTTTTLPATTTTTVFGSTTTTTVLSGPKCSQPLTDGADPTASDCLFILRAAVGTLICTPECICDVNATGSTTATDALTCLKKAVGQDVTLECLCAGLWITTTTLGSSSSTGLTGVLSPITTPHK